VIIITLLSVHTWSQDQVQVLYKEYHYLCFQILFAGHLLHDTIDMHGQFNTRATTIQLGVILLFVSMFSTYWYSIWVFEHRLGGKGDQQSLAPSITNLWSHFKLMPALCKARQHNWTWPGRGRGGGWWYDILVFDLLQCRVSVSWVPILWSVRR